MTLLTLGLIGMNIGCEDRIDRPAVNASDGEPVEVTFNIGLDNKEDGYNLSALSATKATAQKGAAFDVQLTPSVATRAKAYRPDQLYKLEIRQYDQSGKHLAGLAPADYVIGTRFTGNLIKADDCQLVFVAWGKGSTKSLGEVPLSDAQGISIDASDIKNLSQESQDDMNKMPYVLHLEHVNVTDAGLMVSPDGEDVRVLLKRLATHLTFNWTYSFSGYSLKQILLQSIPLNYKVVAAPDKIDKAYPSLLDQYTTIQLTEAEIANRSYSCWIPANVRGINTASSSPTSRSKAYAPTGSVYASFIAVNDNDIKKKLNYRVYLGGRNYSDYNLYNNVDYNYTINFIHDKLPTNDDRVTIIDPIPASENNNGLVPTANCFMVVPGGAFCFNPYKYYSQGKETENSLLQGWCDSTKIKSVKVLWQTLENGDVGDPVLGVINSSEDHTNIVDLKDGDNFKNARIYCRVASNTTGGSGVIAAYDDTEGKGNILWSWHIWVTQYTPDSKANVSVDDENKRIQKYTYGGKEQYPMMDRNLGAQAGYTNAPEGDLARSKANGFHYQYGRKDPFPSTYSSSIGVWLSINKDKPTPGMLNYYQPDGVSFYVRTAEDRNVTLRGSFQNPTTTYTANNKWCSEYEFNFWDGDNKAFSDPCPSGWRVASKSNFRPLFVNTDYEISGAHTEVVPMNMVNRQSLFEDGGAVIYFENEKKRTTYIRFTGYQDHATSFIQIGRMANLWCRESSTVGTDRDFGHALSVRLSGFTGKDAFNISGQWRPRDSHPTRCIQDRSSK